MERLPSRLTVGWSVRRKLIRLGQFAAFVGTWAGSAEVLRISYGAELFAQWPWIRTVGAVTVVSLLLGVVAGYGRRIGRADRDLASFSVVLVIPFTLVLLYPGPAALGLMADPYAGALLFVWVIQMVLFFAARELTYLEFGEDSE